MTETTASEAIFHGLRVIDAASFIAAPTAAMMLGDLGADVIKIEPPGEGDPYRVIQDDPAFPQGAAEPFWILDGRCKRSLSLNLKHEEGRRILLELVKGCDVYITNQPFPVRKRLRLEYEDLAPLNERMIFASLTAYGETGPERDASGFDGVAYWGRSGLEDLVRARGAAPSPSLAGQGDHPTGVSLFAAIVTALYRRTQTGRGGHVHSSLLANGYWSNSCLGQSALAGADFETWRRRPEDAPGPFVRGVHETSDGRFLQFIMVRSDEHQEELMRQTGMVDMMDDPRFATPEARAENPLPLIRALSTAIRGATAAEWLARFQTAGLAVTLVRRTEEIGDDRQAIVNDVLIAPPPDGPDVPWVINHPVRVDGAQTRGAVRPPKVGEHTAEILEELGFGPAQIAEFRRTGVV